MILTEIYIDGFGIFNGFSIKNLKSGINIITGRNEAGKSTLLKFIRFTLFGYPRLREQRMSPLRGGDHGGRMKILMSSGKEILLDRSGTDQLTFLSDGVSFQDKNQWSDMLGNASDSIFGNIYAFSIDELIDMGSITASGFEDRIFSIGSGLGNISIADISNNIQNRADAIYKPKGTNQKIPLILKDIEEKKRSLESVRDNLDRYRELQERLSSLTDGTTALEKEISSAVNEKNKLENYLKCYSSFVTISSIDKELAGLPALNDYPAGGLETLTELEQEESGLKKKIRELLEGNDDSKGINDLENEEKTLVLRDGLLAGKDYVDFLGNNLELYIQTLADRQDLSRKLDSLTKGITESLKNISTGWTEQNIVALNELLVHQDRINSFKSEFESIDRKKLETEMLLKVSANNKRITNTRNLIVMVSILMFLASFPFFIYKLFVAGAICIISALVLLLGRRFILVKDPGKEGLKEFNELTERDENLRKTYENYLAESLHLSRNLTPDAVLGILSLVRDLKDDISGRADIVAAMSGKNSFIENFESIVTKFSNIIRFDSDETISRVRQILKEYSHDKEISVNKAAIAKDLDIKKRSLNRAMEDLELVNGRIQSLLDSIIAGDREDYKSKYGKNKKVFELLSARKKEITTIETIAGMGKSDEVLEYLKDNSRDSIAPMYNEIDETLKKKNAGLGSKKEETGRIRQELKQIEGKADIAEIMTGIETDRKKLEIEYHNWLANKVALKILSEVRRKFEKEKQPEVIKNSSLHFRKITGGRFSRISASMDKKEITVFDVSEAGKRIDQLSRGTREQLLLSLRLGFIEEYERHSEPLPVIVDEIFVNFDPERTKKTIEIFQDFAGNRQVMIFTCHPSTVDYFRQSEVNIIDL